MFRKGQSTLEYALIIAVVIAVIVVMQKFMSGGVGGRLKASVDDIGGQFNVNGFVRTTTTTYPSGSDQDVAIEAFGYSFDTTDATGVIDNTADQKGVSSYEVKKAAKRKVDTKDDITEKWGDEGKLF